MTLLEVVLALSLMSVISVLSAHAVRTTRQAWDIQDQRSDRLQHLSGTLAHITRGVRTARDVVSVSGPTVTAGNLEITLPDDSVVKWLLDDIEREVRYEIDGASPAHLLATGVNSLTFECFQIDGVTPTTVPADVRLIRVTASVTTPVQGTPLSLRSTVWIRKQRDATAAPYLDFYASNWSSPNGWFDPSYFFGPPDGLSSYGDAGASISSFGFDTSTHSGTVGTVLVGLYVAANGPIGEDVVDIQIRRGSSSDLGPVRSFGAPVLTRFENNSDWLWVDITDDFASWTYEDIDTNDFRVLIANRDAGVGGARISVDSVVVRAFESGPVTETYWLTAEGTWNGEWLDRDRALGAPNASYARSNLTFDNDVDRQAYFFNPSVVDLGTIVRVRILVTDYFIDAPFVNNRFSVRFPATSEAPESNDTPVPVTAREVPVSELNLHVGEANLGSVSMDFTGLDSLWTWPSLNARFVRLYGASIGVPDGGNIKLDAVAVEVRYVPPSLATVVLWEEL